MTKFKELFTEAKETVTINVAYPEDAEAIKKELEKNGIKIVSTSSGRAVERITIKAGKKENKLLMKFKDKYEAVIFAESKVEDDLAQAFKGK